MSPALSAVLPLSGWENFYVIVGSSAAALTGLTFIVITISADRSERTDRSDGSPPRLFGLRAYITPTVVHFSASLLISALQSVPGHTALSLALCVGITGALGTLYCGRVIYWMVRMAIDSHYKPFFEDWVWNAALPFLTYLCLFVVAWLLPAHPELSLRFIAGIALLLLFVGIHNAWDVVAWLTTERDARKAPSKGG